MTTSNRTRPATPRRTLLGSLLAAVALIPLAACQETYQDTEAPAAAEDRPTAAGPEESWEALGDSLAESLTEMPADSAARSVLAYLEGAEYGERWSHWPDRDPYYEGTDPHGMLLSTYLNDRAEATLSRLMEGNEDHLPMGSFVVKENHGPDSSLVAVTVMIKAGRGYDPEHNDWFWLKYAPSDRSAGLPAAEVEAAGRVESCISCHDDAGATTDFLMTAGAQMEGNR